MLKFLLVPLALVSLCASAFVGRNINYAKDQYSAPGQDLDNGRIVGGRTVDIGMHPHQISLRIKLASDVHKEYKHCCGGSIISSTMIVTAAHCVFGRMPSEYLVVAGGNQREGSDGVIVPIKEIIAHEYFDVSRLTNDIALLILATPLPLNNFTVKAIELADGVVKDSEIATVTGWGITELGGAGPLADFLQEVKVPIISNELCSKDFHYKSFVPDIMICAGLHGVGGKSTCFMDSGGPLSINGKLAGVASLAFDCAVPEYPGVYTRISYFRSWLLEKIANYQ